MLDPRQRWLQHGPGATLGKLDLQERVLRLVSARTDATQTPKSTNEASLLERLRRAEPEAIDQLYREQQHVLRAYAQRLIGERAAAEDLVHDVFVQLPALLARFRGESNLRSYLLGVATHLSRHYVVKARRRRKLLDRFPTAGEDGQPSPERVYQAQQERAGLQAALDALPLRQRAAFVLCEVEERGAREVAEILGVPESTVRTRCFHARKRLKAHLAGRSP